MENLNQKTHPEDNRNLIIFVIISLILWFGYDTYVLQPKIKAQQEAQRALAEERETALGLPDILEERPREDVITEAKRIEIENDVIFGSLNLKGARLDDVSLHDYYVTTARENEIAVLSPAGTPYPKYAETGWVSVDEDLNLPNNDTVWSISGNQTLAPDQPVTLFWNNGQGIRFEKIFSIDNKYLITIEQRAINNRNSSAVLSPYALVSEHGLPEDFTGRFIVHEGPIGYIGKDLEERSYKKMRKEQRLSLKADQGWIGITEKYWLTAILPEQVEELNYRFAFTPARSDKDKDRYQVDIVSPSKAVKSGETFTHTTQFFVGAKEVQTLNAYKNDLGIPNLDLAVDFGMFYFLTVPFFWVLHFFYTLVGNFGVAILMITLCLRVLVFPLANTSYKSFAKLRKVSPQMLELRQKYSDDKQTLQKELVKLYEREKVNPAAGCLPILVQIPIFFALFKVLSISIEMRHQPFFGWIQDLSAPDPTSLFNGFGLIPWDPPSFLMIGIWPCLMLVTMIIQKKMSPPPQDKMQAQMMNIMPFAMTFILAKFASGLVIYWTFSNFLSVIQQYVIMKNMGVEPHLFKKDKGEKIEEVNEPTVEKEDETETEPTVQKDITPPKPKKSKKKK
ncbi:MAG: membrane protein insertase YidC [Pseudomonadota bacterium]